VTEHYKEWIPKTIKAFRLTNDMTLSDLSVKTGLSVSYLSDLERGRTVPPLDTLDKILMAFGTTLSLGVQKDYTPTGYMCAKPTTGRVPASVLGLPGRHNSTNAPLSAVCKSVTSF